MRRARLRSLAKINLDLRVLQKNPDGFHELRTVFQTISLADSIEVEYAAAKRRSITIEDSFNIPDNLVVRAAHAVLDAIHVNAAVKFKLIKKIPMGGGLGGGSSNAAAVLLSLPVLARCKIGAQRLQGLAQDLGSDVPFFLHGGTQLGVGRGTELYPQPDVRNEPILLIAPAVGVATGPAYAGLARGLTFAASSSSINSFQAYVRTLGEERSAFAASTFSANDFEPVVFKQYPQLARIAARLRKFSPAVRMSGSGSTIFAVFPTVTDRKLAVKSGLFDGCRLIEAALVSRNGYQRMWRKQLGIEDETWPPRSKRMDR